MTKKEREEKDAEINRLNKKLEVWKNILNNKTLPQAGYYVLNKEVYDQNKTELSISNCDLGVSLVKDSGKEAHHLHFKWTLEVANSTSVPVNRAIFIYSGDKDDYTLPDVSYQNTRVEATMEKAAMAELAVGDDRIIEISFPNDLNHNQAAKICIEYTLSKYEFNPKIDYIWLVPDALGFADMSGFRIRFFYDGDIINKKTTIAMRSYTLSEIHPYKDKVIHYDDSIMGLEFNTARGNQELKGYGFLLALVNDLSALPFYLEDHPIRNT